MTDDGLGSWIHRRRVKSARHTAIVFEGRSISYPELADRIDRLAEGLRIRGVGTGSRVAYLGENHPSFLEALFATCSIGAIFVPLNTRLAAPEIQYALADSGSTVLVHAGSLSSLADAGARDTAVVHRLAVDDSGASAGGRGGENSYEDLVGTGEAPHPDAEVSLDDAAVLLYTSGTTGRPKGAMLTHGNLTWNALNVLVDYDLVSTDVALMISPLFHAASLGMGALPVLMKGATLLLMRRFEAGRVLEIIETHRATWISGVPTTYQLLAEHPDWVSRDLSSLQKLTCGGSAVPARVLDAYEQRGLSFTGGYGMTETSPGATSLQPSRSRDKAGSAGLPHFFTRVRVVDEQGTECTPGQVGEIQVAGPNVIPRYWNRPDATAEAFADGSWFRSGDVGYTDEEGFLYVSDRLKDMIISGGENVYPAEVEQHILEVEGVGAVAVIGVPDEKWGEVPHAVVSPREGFAVTENDILRHLDGRIARYKIPKSIVFVDELPRTASGKVRKNVLREQLG